VNPGARSTGDVVQAPVAPSDAVANLAENGTANTGLAVAFAEVTQNGGVSPSFDLPVTFDAPAASAAKLQSAAPFGSASGALSLESAADSSARSGSAAVAVTAGDRFGKSEEAFPMSRTALPVGQAKYSAGSAFRASDAPKDGAGFPGAEPETSASGSTALNATSAPTSVSAEEPAPGSSFRGPDRGHSMGAGGAAAAAAEKIAAFRTPSSENPETTRQAPDKKILGDNNKSLIKDNVVFGTTGARPSTAMPAQSFARSFAAFATGVATAGSVAGAGGKANSLADSTPSTATAREAVDAVLRIADAQAGRADSQAHVVNIGFKIGGEDLSVRVELHGTEVRTQFSTNSPELRAALSGEWQGFAPGGGSHNLKFSDPEFAQSNGSSNSSFAEGGADYRRQEKAGERGPSGWSSMPADESEPESAEAGAVAVPVPLGASAHLRAFA
jgi:hypothetical protein